MRHKINGDKIYLQRYEIEFAPLLYEAAIESSGGEFTRWMPWCHENYEFADSESFIEQTVKNWDDKTQFGFAIFDAKTNGFLGGVGLNQPNDNHKFYNLGYWIRVSKHNRPLAK